MTIGAFGAAHLVGFGAILPLAAFRSRRRLARLLELPRSLHFTLVLGQQLVFLALSGLVAWRERITLFPERLPAPAPTLVALVFLAASLWAIHPLWHRMVERRDPRVHLMMPRTGPEKLLWTAISLVAGVGEEVTFRGVLYTLLLRLLGSTGVAVGLAAAAFGASHAVQGWRAVLLAVLFGLGFHLLVVVSGSLYLAMGVHVAYDLVAGLRIGRLGERMGYPADGRVSGAT
jgi:membrane protease YdiL (CAAX protease family)